MFADKLCQVKGSSIKGFDTAFLAFADKLVEFGKLLSLEAIH
jgi:hypothetical protein